MKYKLVIYMSGTRGEPVIPKFAELQSGTPDDRSHGTYHHAALVVRAPNVVAS